MTRRLHSGDVVVADANVFNDFISRLGVRRSNPHASLALFEAVKTCCARFGYTRELLQQYLTSEPQARPILGGDIAKAVTLIGLEKIFIRPVSAGRWDEEDPRAYEFPREDRFLLHVAVAVKAKFIVTTDPGIPLGERVVPQHNGGTIELEVIEPRTLIERIVWPAQR